MKTAHMIKTVSDSIDWHPQRIVIAGVSGVGKTTLGQKIAELAGFPRTELDGLYWGGDWTPRDDFLEEVQAFVGGERWVTEWQYRKVRPLIAARADTIVWLDYSTPRQMFRLITRTVSRSVAKKKLWNGNVEQPLWTIFNNPDHILRWGWKTRNSLKELVPTLEERFAPLAVVRLKSPKETKRWLRAYGESLKL